MFNEGRHVKEADPPREEGVERRLLGRVHPAQPQQRQAKLRRQKGRQGFVLRRFDTDGLGARGLRVVTHLIQQHRFPDAPQAEQHSTAVLTAMIGAAKADGHIGPEERALLETELAKLSSDAQDRQWLETELSRPLDPATVARSAQTPEMAAEMYLASLLVVDEESYMERAYLDELARQLKLQPGLKEQLEQHARAAA